MKVTTLKSFEKQLESAYPDHLSCCYLILAKESLMAKRGVDLLKQKVGDIEHISLEGDKLTAEQIRSELGSMSLFVRKRLIVLTRVEKAKEEVKNVLIRFAASPCPDVVCALVGESLASNTKLYKALEKEGVVLNLTGKGKPWELEKECEQWVIDRVALEGKQIDAQTARRLIQTIGTDLAALDQELEKLVCFTGCREIITPSDVGAVCLGQNQKNVWQLGEAIFSLNLKEAMAIAKALLKEETPLILLLRQIRKQFETDYQVALMLSNRAAHEEISKKFPYMRGRILQTHIDSALSYGLERFRKGLIEIDKAELETKNSAIHDECLMERMIAKLCR